MTIEQKKKDWPLQKNGHQIKLVHFKPLTRSRQNICTVNVQNMNIRKPELSENRIFPSSVIRRDEFSFIKVKFTTNLKRSQN